MPLKYNPLLAKLIQEVPPKSNFAGIVAPGVTDDASKGYSVGSIWVDIVADKSYSCLDSTIGAAVWGETSTAAAGEANTVSNIGTAGVGLFKQKTGVDLEFKKINAGSTKITITDDPANNEVDIDVDRIPSSNVDFNVLGTPTYQTAQDWFNIIQTAGIISGFVLSNGRNAAELDVAAGTGIVKTTDSSIGSSVSFDFAGVNNVLLTADNINYIYLDYNAGTPQIAATTDRTSIELNRQFCLGRVFKDGATLHIINAGVHLPNLARTEHERLIERDGFTHASGAITSKIATLDLGITSGVWYLGHNRITTNSLDTSAAGTFIYTHYGLASWITDNATAGLVDATHYNAGTDALGSLGVNNYGTQWVYIDEDSHVYIIYGTENGTLAAAEDASPPSSVPLILSTMGELIAKIIIRQTNVIISIGIVHDIRFTTAGIPNHNDTGGIQGGAANDYYHLTSAEKSTIGSRKISFPAESFYLPETNPATLTEDEGSGTRAGQSHADFDDTTAEHIVARGPVIDYDGGNITIVSTAKAKTPPISEVTLIFDIYTIGIASDESYNRAVTVDTGVDITFTFTFTELMPNQVDRDFSGASNWANVDLNAYDETDDLTITATVAAQYCTCPVSSVPTTIGKKYCLKFDVANIVDTWTIKSFDGTQTLGTVSANGANQQIEWIAETTGGLRIVAVANTSSGDFDNFSLTESDKMIKSTATIDPANVADGDKIVIELIRNVADTLVGDGELIDFTAEYTRA